MRFGRLLVVKDDGTRSKHNHVMWLCKCDCGKEVHIRSFDIGKKTFSCGCYQIEQSVKATKKHGKSDTRIYREWAAMRNRCGNENMEHYDCYGGRGITVCKEWQDSFDVFYQWAMENGYKENLTLDRIDNNLGYSSENCRWATVKEQSNNRRTNHFITYQGKTQTIQMWADEIGVSSRLISHRLQNGWTITEALTTPVWKNGKKLHQNNQYTVLKNKKEN